MQLVINASFGALFGLGLWLIGVPSPLLWGLLGVVLRFVPYIGAPIAALLPLVISLAVDPGWTMPLEVLGLFLATEAVCAYVMEPLLYGHSTGLSPAAIIIAAAFWTSLWGPVGLLLSTPLTACLVVMGRHVPQLEFLEILFGNEQPLPPAVRLYQRLLANDQREAEELTRQHAKEHGLLRAFDEVVLPGLGLVEADRLRGAVDRERLREIAEDVDELVEDVADEHAPPRDRPAAILCCGARGALDDAAGTLLAGVLREQGYDAALAATGAGGTRSRLCRARDATGLRVADGRPRHGPGPPSGPPRPGAARVRGAGPGGLVERRPREERTRGARPQPGGGAGSAHPGRGGVRRPRTAGAAAGADPVGRAGGRRPRSRGLSVSVACPPWPGR